MKNIIDKDGTEELRLIKIFNYSLMNYKSNQILVLIKNNMIQNKRKRNKAMKNY